MNVLTVRSSLLLRYLRWLNFFCPLGICTSICFAGLRKENMNSNGDRPPNVSSDCKEELLGVCRYRSRVWIMLQEKYLNSMRWQVEGILDGLVVIRGESSFGDLMNSIHLPRFTIIEREYSIAK